MASARYDNKLHVEMHRSKSEDWRVVEDAMEPWTQHSLYGSDLRVRSDVASCHPCMIQYVAILRLQQSVSARRSPQMLLPDMITEMALVMCGIRLPTQ